MGTQTKLPGPQERLELILLGVARQQPVETLCRQAGVSRELFYRWMRIVRTAALKALEAKLPGPKATSMNPEKALAKARARLERQEKVLARLRKELAYEKLVARTGQRIIRRNGWGPLPKAASKKNGTRP